LALAAVILATFVRLWLNPWLQGYQPFFSYYATTLLVSWYAGWGCALFATIAGAILAEYFFMPPQFSFMVNDWRDLLELIIYLCISLLSMTLIQLSQGRAKLAQARQSALEEEIRRSKAAEAALRSANTALLRTKTELETANRAKDDFLAICGHELRTPLTPILGWSTILRSGKLDAKRIERGLEVIERNARQQQRIVDDLLDLSRIPAGKIRLEREYLEPSTFVEAAIETVRDLARAKDIKITTVLSDIGDKVVLGDPIRLQQVVCNLLTNAIKFTPINGRIEIRLQQVNGSAELSVMDTGDGIAADFLPRLFQPFSQAETGSDRKYGGLGLGLAIVRRLVEMHGGAVRAESAGKGKGSTFTITLPLERAQPSIRQMASTNEVSLQGVRVLAVDDEADCREFISEALTRCGAQVTTVESAAQALNTIASLKPDVLISDIGMPEQDGHMLIQKLRDLEKHTGHETPAIALTAFADSDSRERTLSEGYQLFLSKPIEANELVKKVVELTLQNTHTTAGAHNDS
jgi:signal transduction histidine kinase/ActR/RegA family two-component response regulator